MTYDPLNTQSFLQFPIPATLEDLQRVKVRNPEWLQTICSPSVHSVRTVLSARLKLAEDAGFGTLGTLVFGGDPTSILISLDSQDANYLVAFLAVRSTSRFGKECRFFVRETFTGGSICDNLVPFAANWREPDPLYRFFANFGGICEDLQFASGVPTPDDPAIRLRDFVMHNDPDRPQLWEWRDALVWCFGDDGDLLLVNESERVAWYRCDGHTIHHVADSLIEATARVARWFERNGTDSALSSYSKLP